MRDVARDKFGTAAVQRHRNVCAVDAGARNVDERDLD
jgi:hypothetical protein